MTLALPLTVLGYWLLRGIGAGADVGQLWDEIGRSIGVSIGAALLTVVACYPVAMVTTWRRRRLSAAVDTSVWAVYSLPHITVGVAVIAFALRFTRPLYQTLGLLLVAYVGMFMAQAASPVQDSLRRANPDLEDASRGLGRGPLQTLARVTVPLTSPGIVAGATLVFISVDQRAARDPAAQTHRLRDVGDSHLELDRGGLLHPRQRSQPRPPHRVDRATLGDDTP